MVTTSFTQEHLTAVEAMIQAKMERKPVGRISLGGISVDDSTTMDYLWSLRDRIKAALQGSAGSTFVSTGFDGIDL